MSPDAVFALRPPVRFRRAGSEAVVVCQDQAEVLVVNQVGARVLELLDGERSLSELLDRLQPDVAVERATLEQDVSAYLEQLLEAQIIERGQATSSAT